MSLTAAELTRLETLEKTIANLAVLVQGGGSKNQLNRLLVLAQDQNRKLTAVVEELEVQMKEVLKNTRKLQ